MITYEKRGGKIHGPYVPDATITPESLEQAISWSFVYLRNERGQFQTSGSGIGFSFLELLNTFHMHSTGRMQWSWKRWGSEDCEADEMGGRIVYVHCWENIQDQYVSARW